MAKKVKKVKSLSADGRTKKKVIRTIEDEIRYLVDKDVHIYIDDRKTKDLQEQLKHERQQVLVLETSILEYKRVCAEAAVEFRSYRRGAKNREFSDELAELQYELGALKKPNWRPTVLFAKFVVSKYFKTAKSLGEASKLRKKLDEVWDKAQEEWTTFGPHTLWEAVRDN